MLNRMRFCLFLALTIPNHGASSKVAFASEKPAPTISVEGTAEILVPPDQVIITVGVSTTEKLIPDCREKKANRVKRVIQVAQESNIRPEHIKTDYLNLREYREHGYDNREDFDGFQMQSTIVITLIDISKFEELMIAVLDNAATHVHDIQFATSELRKYRDQARTKALQAAREKAELMAGELGQRIGAPISIREGYAGWHSWYRSWWGGGAYRQMNQNVMQSAGPASVPAEGIMSPGQLSVSASVSVTFEMSPKDK